MPRYRGNYRFWTLVELPGLAVVGAEEVTSSVDGPTELDAVVEEFPGVVDEFTPSVVSCSIVGTEKLVGSTVVFTVVPVDEESAGGVDESDTIKLDNKKKMNSTKNFLTALPRYGDIMTYHSLKNDSYVFSPA